MPIKFPVKQSEFATSIVHEMLFSQDIVIISMNLLECFITGLCISSMEFGLIKSQMDIFLFSYIISYQDPHNSCTQCVYVCRD